MSGSNVGTAYLQILPTTKGMKGNLQKELAPDMDSAGKSAGGKFGGLFTSALKKYITAAAIGTAITKSVQEGAALEQSLGGVETLYKEHASTVIKNANEAYKTAGLSANDYMEQSTKFAASLLQSLGGDTKAAANYADMALVDMSDNANKFGTNIEDIQNAYQGFSKQNYTMLDNLKLGYGGTKTEMERLLADASKLSGQEYDISNLNDVYDAIHVVQDELGVTGTTSREAASTLSGSFDSMKASATNLLGSLALGKNVGPAFEGLIDSANTFFTKNLVPAILKIAKSLPKIIITAISKGVPVVARALPGLVKQIFNAAVNILNQFTQKITQFTKSIGNNPGVLAGIVRSGLKIMKSLATALIKGIGSLSVAVIKLQVAVVKMFASLGRKAASKLLSSIRSGLSGVGAAIRGKLSSVGSAIAAPFKNGWEKVKGIVNKIKNAFKNATPKLNLKLPDVGLKWKKSKLGVEYPWFTIKWKQLAKGGMVNDPTVLGYQYGEAGPEAVLPLNPFWNKLSDEFSSLKQSMTGTAGGGNLTVVMQLDGQTIGQSTVEYINGQTIQYGASPIVV